MRALRDAIADHRWDAAADCFSRDLIAKNAAEMQSGRFFRKMLAEPISLGGYRDGFIAAISWPMTERDVLLGVDLEAGKAIATIDRANLTKEDPRPEKLYLEKDAAGSWKIVGWSSS